MFDPTKSGAPLKYYHGFCPAKVGPVFISTLNRLGELTAELRLGKRRRI